ncbi:MAG TPA: RES family NAD+ phosphorylase [Bryobacteraceae bacterium]|nr:RES family NAD+ phosphorylase [Bryobacteraceae bacterium]
MRAPPSRPFRWDASHRLIPSRYSEAGTVLAEIADTDAMLADIMLLDGSTNDRIQGEEHGLIGISTFELVYGIPNAHIVNAAFTHTNDSGSRFNDHTRGAWYAAAELETSIVEVTYHKARRLAEIVVPELPGGRPDEDLSTYDDWLADFRSTFHVLDPADQFSEYLQPEPIPQCYARSQELARMLLDQRSNGLVYTSVRRAGGRCLVCFRPALVYHPRRGERLEIRFRARAVGYEYEVHSVPRTGASSGVL